jgi:hypothetical protein
MPCDVLRVQPGRLEKQVFDQRHGREDALIHGRRWLTDTCVLRETAFLSGRAGVHVRRCAAAQATCRGDRTQDIQMRRHSHSPFCVAFVHQPVPTRKRSCPQGPSLSSSSFIRKRFLAREKVPPRKKDSQIWQGLYKFGKSDQALQKLSAHTLCIHACIGKARTRAGLVDDTTFAVFTQSSRSSESSHPIPTVLHTEIVNWNARFRFHRCRVHRLPKKRILYV